MRTVIHQPQFAEDAAALEPDTQMFDDIIEGIDWMLARNPEAGEQVGHTRVWAITTKLFINRREDLVDWVVYYEFDDQTVWLLSVIEKTYDF